ncbi:hypothetical protein NESM_000668200 [Novymonas esmeraldas]|uniref:PDZ domain-containing protein n=1 Tax=Novymonas esmeraldas TaxID=1808958 RepID=A0AAW0EWS5_9TRYP
MTTALNRKFDVLCHSGTCPSYLVDVLSLLVAHANDTELFKTELRHGGGGGYADTRAGGAAGARAASFSGPAGHSSHVTQDEREQQAEDRRRQLMYKQVEDPAALDDALRASHESVLIAAERSLQTYAEDLKHINDIAMATSAKQLRAMRVETQQQMESFRDRVCSDVVERTKEELEEVRGELATSVRADASDMVRQLQEVSLTAEQQLHTMTCAYSDFVAHAHDALTVAPLVDAHKAATAVAYVQEHLTCIEATTATRSEVGMLGERLKDLERIVAALSSVADTPDAATRVALVQPLSTPQPQQQQQRPPLSLRSASHSNPPSRLPSPPRSQASASASRSASAQGRPRSPPLAMARPRARETLAERLGVCVEAAEDGVVLTSVVPGSPADLSQLGVGHIISHVGRAAVATPTAFEQALRASDGPSAKITTYNPFHGRIRVLSLQLS